MVQILRKNIPIAISESNQYVSGLGFRGHCEDEKNSEKIRSLDLFVLLDQAKRTNNLGLCPKLHFIFLLDKKNETKRIKKKRSYPPTGLPTPGVFSGLRSVNAAHLYGGWIY